MSKIHRAMMRAEYQGRHVQIALMNLSDKLQPEIYKDLSPDIDYIEFAIGECRQSIRDLTDQCNQERFEAMKK